MTPAHIRHTLTVLLLLIPFYFLCFYWLSDFYIDPDNSHYLGANPIEFTVRFLGDWALRMLLMALAVTPLRYLTRWNWLAPLRRTVGLTAYAYVVAHLLSWIVLDQYFDWYTIGTEIVKAKFILVGMAAVLILTALAVTSTKGMIKHLTSQRWQKLHKWIYAAGILGAMHYYMMVKADIRLPLIHGAILALLLLLRMRSIRNPIINFLHPQLATAKAPLQRTK